MKRNVGVVSRGIRGPIIRSGDDVVSIVADSLGEVLESERIVLNDNDILGITEAVVAKSQQNFVLLEDIKEDFKEKYNDEIGIVFPILSRNRFSNILKAIALGVDKIYIQLSYPGDEVGNRLVSQERFDEIDLNPYSDVLNEEEFYEAFGFSSHEFTGVDYVQLYKSICNGRATIIFSNNPKTILKYTKKVLAADIHTRHRTKKILRDAGAEVLYSLDEIMTKPINNSGYNPEYGLLGSNLSSDDRLKLFPRDCTDFVYTVQREIANRFNVNINVMVYGDGCLKDSTEGIWELADPVVSPGFTEKLGGIPTETKFKYVADTVLKDLSKEVAEEEMKKILNVKQDDKNSTSVQGTTPRKLTDFLGSLCDLTSGSGDKGTPFVLIQGYFDTYAD